MADRGSEPAALLTELVGGRAGEWDLSGGLPVETLRRLSAEGVLAASVEKDLGGLGLSSLDNGELTAHAGSLDSSLRSGMTSHGMVAWAVERFGDDEQRGRYLPRLTGGEIAAVSFSEPGAGSKLSAMTTTITPDGSSVVIDGTKKWVTFAAYADLILVFGRHADGGGAAVLVPADAAGLRLDRIPHPLGCRAAGHCDLQLDGVRLPASAVLGGGGQTLTMLATTALAYGRISVAWGCVGILRACLAAATRHARLREQGGVPLSSHQLVSRHLAELYVSERIATLAAERASRCWDEQSPDGVAATVVAKHVAATRAAHGSASAVQVLGSAGAEDGELVARAFRDAKLMEVIEGSNEICQLILARQALEESGRSDGRGEGSL